MASVTLESLLGKYLEEGCENEEVKAEFLAKLAAKGESIPAERAEEVRSSVGEDVKKASAKARAIAISVLALASLVVPAGASAAEAESYPPTISRPYKGVSISEGRVLNKPAQVELGRLPGDLAKQLGDLAEALKETAMAGAYESGQRTIGTHAKPRGVSVADIEKLILEALESPGNAPSAVESRERILNLARKSAVSRRIEGNVRFNQERQAEELAAQLTRALKGEKEYLTSLLGLTAAWRNGNYLTRTANYDAAVEASLKRIRSSDPTLWEEFIISEKEGWDKIDDAVRLAAESAKVETGELAPLLWAAEQGSDVIAAMTIDPWDLKLALMALLARAMHYESPAVQTRANGLPDANAVRKLPTAARTLTPLSGEETARKTRSLPRGQAQA